MPHYGINVDPDNPAGLPHQPQDLRGLKWVRFVFQAQPHVPRTIEQSCAFYAPIVEAFAAQGVRTLLVLNHQLYVGEKPWEGSGSWRRYAVEFSARCAEVARCFKGLDVAYEVWNESDQGSESAVYVPPQDFALLLQATSAAVKTADPAATVVLGGLVSGRPRSYLLAVAEKLGGLPVDAIGIHPYGKGPAGDNGIVPYVQSISTAFPNIPLWITEFGDHQIVKQRYEVIEYYMRLIDDVLRRALAQVVPVAIWYCWSDGMNPGFGITDAHRQPKGKVYSTYFLLNKLNHEPPCFDLPLAVAQPLPDEELVTERSVEHVLVSEATPTRFTHQQLINALYEAAQAVGDNPWVWFRYAGLTYLTKDRKKVYAGTPIDDLPNLTPLQKTLIQRALRGEPLDTISIGDTDDEHQGEDDTPPKGGDTVSPAIPKEKVLDIQWVSQFDPVGTPNTDCGDACVLMLLWYYRYKTPDARIVFMRLWGTTVAEELQSLAKEYGLTLTTEPISVERLPALIAANKPVIFLVDYKRLGFPVHLRSGVNQGNHWLVVVGYNETGFIVHDPLWMPAQRSGMGGAYLPIERETLRKAMISHYVMVYPVG